MRAITPIIPPEYQQIIPDANKIPSSAPVTIKSFRKLVEATAKFAYYNKDYLLFFRGQAKDYFNKAGSSSFYPTIYRDGYLRQSDLRNRFDILEGSAKILVDSFQAEGIDGHRDLKRRKLIQWSILQHYEVCPTPLLDFTQSLRVACSFAQLNCKSNIAYVFVFGFPYVMNRISHNSEHDLVNVRLLSICPPEALRPHFQEGYLVGTDEITDNYDQKTELDFNARLIVKFEIPNDNSFWGRGFHRIPKQSLYPKNDPIQSLCDRIQVEASRHLKAGDIGDFLQIWAEVEELVKMFSGKGKEAYVSFRKALNTLYDHHKISNNLYKELDDIRSYRNIFVHKPAQVESDSIPKLLLMAENALRDLKKSLSVGQDLDYYESNNGKY